MDETGGDQGATSRIGGEAGDRLRAAREAAGLTLAEVAQRTRVPLRHLEAIERGTYDELPSQTYAVGFARAYARSVGADEVATAGEVRTALARLGPRAAEYEPYEIKDPARIPSRGLAIVAAGVALAVLILAGLWFGTDLFRRTGAEPAPTTAPSASATVAAAPKPATAAVPAATGGQVRLTANDEVWLRVYDADNKTLFLGTLKPGDHFDVPADARDPQINVGRPDKLAVTLDGRPVPPLGKGDHAIKDVKVSGAAIAARLAAAPAPGATPSATPSPSPSPSRSPAARSHRDEPRPRPSPTLSETQRANLDAVPPPAAGGNATP